MSMKNGLKNRVKGNSSSSVVQQQRTTAAKLRSHWETKSRISVLKFFTNIQAKPGGLGEYLQFMH